MKARFLIPAFALIVAPFTQTFADDGPTLFRNNCGACHTVGKGKLVGPDLKDVQNRHADSWLHKWIKSSQGLVQAGDKDAVKLFADNGNIPMPDQALSDDDIKTVLAYISSGGDQPVAATATAPTTSGPDNIAIATQKAAQDKANSGSLLTMFSFTEYLLMFLMGIMLIIIWVMGTAIKSLSEKVEDTKAEPANI